MKNLPNFICDKKFNRVILKINSSYQFFPCENILYIKSGKRYVTFFFINRNDELKIINSLSNLQNILPSDFFRCNRSLIVNLRHILEIIPHEKKFHKLILPKDKSIIINTSTTSKLLGYIQNIGDFIDSEE